MNCTGFTTHSYETLLQVLGAASMQHVCVDLMALEERTTQTCNFVQLGDHLLLKLVQHGVHI